MNDKLQELLKNKKILIPAILIGAVAGLYVLSRQSGGSGGGGLQPESPLQPQQPGTGDGGGADGDIIGRLTQLEANQTGFQSQFMQALQSLADNFNNALSGVRGENASALQSVIDQVNSQLGSGQYTQNQTVPDFAGFQSQLMQALAAANNIPQRVADTGSILKNTGGALTPARSSANIIAQIQNQIGGNVNAKSSKPFPFLPKGGAQPSPGFKLPTFSYPGTRRGGGSSFVSVPRLDPLAGLSQLRGAFMPSTKSIPTAPKTSVVKKVTGGGGSVFFKK